MRFNLTKNSVIKYFISVILQQRTKSNLLALIEEKAPKDLVLFIFGFLSYDEILPLCRISRAFNDFVKNYNKSLISLKDAKHQHTIAIQEFNEQKDLLPKKLNRNNKMVDYLFLYAGNAVEFFGIINLSIAKSFQSVDQTEVFMRTSYHQASCPNNGAGNALENIANAGMIFGLVMILGKIVMTGADSHRQAYRGKLNEQKVSQTALYLKNRNEMLSVKNPVKSTIPFSI